MVPLVGVLFIMNFGAFVNAQMSRDHDAEPLRATRAIDIRVDIDDADQCAKGTRHVHIRRHVSPVGNAAGVGSTFEVRPSAFPTVCSRVLPKVDVNVLPKVDVKVSPKVRLEVIESPTLIDVRLR
jgi:hypothetical protein